MAISGVYLVFIRSSLSWRQVVYMTCFSPLQAYISSKKNELYTFSYSDAYFESGLTDNDYIINGTRKLGPLFSCGRCIGCRIDRSRHWATRVACEAMFHKCNSFLTLTYSDDNYPVNGSLDFDHLRDFVKRLRWHLSDKFGLTVRYFACGEYGSRLSRPHFHLCLHGFDFSFDRVLFKFSNGNPLYVSSLLQACWQYGYSWIGNLTYQSAAYTARYIVKKWFGDQSDQHYGVLEPEDVRMSLKPGIANTYFDKYFSTIYPNDFIILSDGRKVRPPRYFDKLLKERDIDLYAYVKRKRMDNMRKYKFDNTPDRLAVLEELQYLRLNRLVRSFENEDVFGF